MIEKLKTQNSHRRLSTLNHLEALGLKCKTDRKGKKTKGKGLNTVRNDFKALKQSEKMNQDQNSSSESPRIGKP